MKLKEYAEKINALAEKAPDAEVVDVAEIIPSTYEELSTFTTPEDMKDLEKLQSSLGFSSMPRVKIRTNKIQEEESCALKACEAIIEASLFWNGEWEDRHPEFKRARTLAGKAIQIKENEED